MRFFESLPPPVPDEEPARPPRPAWMRPEAALGGVVATELLLARTDDSAVAIIGLLAFPTGFEFTVAAVRRQEDTDGLLFHLGFHPGPRRPDEPLSDEFLRLGVRFADGRVATNLNRMPFRTPSADPTGPLLLSDGGGGGGRRYDMDYWVWPLPPPGPLTFVCEWPAAGVPESQAEIDAQLILDASRRAVQLWPES